MLKQKAENQNIYFILQFFLFQTTLMECFGASPQGEGSGAPIVETGTTDVEHATEKPVFATCAVCEMRANGMYFGAMVCLPCKVSNFYLTKLYRTQFFVHIWKKKLNHLVTFISPNHIGNIFLHAYTKNKRNIVKTLNN